MTTTINKQHKTLVAQEFKKTPDYVRKVVIGIRTNEAIKNRYNELVIQDARAIIESTNQNMNSPVGA